jgi:hypothetical protein
MQAVLPIATARKQANIHIYNYSYIPYELYQILYPLTRLLQGGGKISEDREAVQKSLE